MKFGPRWGWGEHLQDTATAVVFHEDISFIFHSSPYVTSLLSEYFLSAGNSANQTYIFK